MNENNYMTCQGIYLDSLSIDQYAVREEELIELLRIRDIPIDFEEVIKYEVKLYWDGVGNEEGIF